MNVMGSCGKGHQSMQETITRCQGVSVRSKGALCGGAASHIAARLPTRPNAIHATPWPNGMLTQASQKEGKREAGLPHC